MALALVAFQVADGLWLGLTGFVRVIVIGGGASEAVLRRLAKPQEVGPALADRKDHSD